jgi:hypothetical protein
MGAHVEPLADFIRYVWVSERAREIWEPRIAAAIEAWLEIELLSVLAGVRPCSLRLVDVADLMAISQRAASFGLSVLPVQPASGGKYIYRTVAAPAEEAKVTQFFCAIGKIDVVREMQEAWSARLDARVGEFLGYPPCCVNFFTRIWAKATDTTWHMAINTPSAVVVANSAELVGRQNCNICLRWLGIRAVPHLPCSFECEGTDELGRQLLTIGESSGFKQEVDWIRNMLAWPVEWSALHGIAEIKTPILKIATNTDVTPERYLVRRTSEIFPEEKGVGTSFPFEVSHGKLDSTTNLAEFPEEPINSADDIYYYDNGFSSAAAMHAAHMPIVRAAQLELLRQSSASADELRVIDIGAGNGALLRKLCELIPNLLGDGVEISHNKIVRASVSLHHDRVTLHRGDVLADVPGFPARRYGLAIVPIWALPDMASFEPSHFMSRVLGSAMRTLVYAYPDAHARLIGRFASWEQSAVKKGLLIAAQEQPSQADVKFCLIESDR